MRYMGGKQKTAKDIASVLNRHPMDSIFLEPFMGSCWVTCEVQIRNRVAGDLHKELVALYQALQDGWEPPHSLSRSEFEDIRRNRTSGKYPRHLVAFAGFGCAYAGSYWRSYAGEVYALWTRNSLLRKKPKLRDVVFYHGDYRDLNPSGCVIYCDPPYQGVSYGFRITGRRGNGSFDSNEFWAVVRKWGEKNIVYVSEYEAPQDFKLIWEREVRTWARKTGGSERRRERLFVTGEGTNLTSFSMP
jgi:DNA adenine methylase